MSDTPNFDYDLPTVDGDEGIWGTKLNNIITQIDSDLAQTLGNPASWANMEKNGADKTGVANIYDSLVAAQLASDIIYFGKGTYNLATNITLSANKLLVFEKGAVLSVANGVTLTANNTLIQAGLWQIFNLNTSGILAGTWDVKQSYPEWFGAVGDGVTDDLVPIQKTVDSFDKIYFYKDKYIITSPVTVSNKTNLYYKSKYSIIEISAATVNNIFQFEACENVTVDGLEFEWSGTDLTFVTIYHEIFALRFRADTDSPYTPCKNVNVVNCKSTQMLLVIMGNDNDAQASMTYARQNKEFNIENNIINCIHDSNSVSAISGFYTSFSTVKGNKISDKDSTGAQVSTNEVSGIHFKGGNLGNEIYFNSTDNIISENILNVKGSGVFIGSCDNIEVNNNVIKNCDKESIDFESSRHCKADSNIITEADYALAVFYAYEDITFSNNKITLKAGASYGFNHSALTATDNSKYGNIYFYNNSFRGYSESGNQPIIQLAYGQHVEFKDNNVYNVGFYHAGTCYGEIITGNHFIYDQEPTSLSMFMWTGTLEQGTNYLNPSVIIKNNKWEWISGTATGILALLPRVPGGTFNSTILIENNEFINFQYPIDQQNSGSSADYCQHIIRNNVFGGTFVIPILYGAGGACKNRFLEGNKAFDGRDLYGSPENYVTLNGSAGCKQGSVIYSNNIITGNPNKWVNVSTTGGTDFKPAEWVLPVISSTTTALEDITNAINTTLKVTWKKVYNATTGVYVYAAGTAAANVWIDETTAIIHTPV